MAGRDRFTNVPLDVEHRGSGAPAQGPRGPGGWPSGEFSVSGSLGGQGAAQFSVSAPWVERPSSATDFQLQSTLVARTSANTPAIFPELVQIPQGNVAVIRSVALLANNLLVTSDLRWTIRTDGVPMIGWNRITIPPRAAGSVEVSYGPDETYAHVAEGRLIDVQFEVIDPGSYQVSVSLHGWFYSAALYYAARAAYGNGGG